MEVTTYAEYGRLECIHRGVELSAFPSAQALGLLSPYVLAWVPHFARVGLGYSQRFPHVPL